MLLNQMVVLLVLGPSAPHAGTCSWHHSAGICLSEPEPDGQNYSLSGGVCVGVWVGEVGGIHHHLLEQ